MEEIRRRAIKGLKGLIGTREPRREIVWALLGDAEGTVVVPGKAGKVYCRLFGQTSLTVRAWNRAVSPTAGLRVEVEVLRQEGMPTDYWVLGLERAGYSGYENDGMTYLPAHGATHERRPGGGADVVNVYKRAITELRADQQLIPDMTVAVSAGFYLTTLLEFFSGGNSPAFAAAPGGIQTRYDLLYLNTVTDALAVRQGIAGIPGFAGKPQPQANEVPIAWVKFTTETAIVDSMIIDARVTVATMGAYGIVAAHSLLSAAHGDTTADTVVAGDIITGDATPKWVRLARGTANYVLKAGASVLAWGQVAWEEITNKPATFPPDPHKNEHKSGGGDAFASTDVLEAIVKRLQESSGPTNLLMGAVADGEFLKRSGTDIIGGEAGAGGGGGMMPFWEFRGALAVLAGAGTPIRMPYAGTIEAVLLLVETKGSASSTIIDIHKAGVTIFTTQANRPEVVFNDPDDFDVSVPDVAAFDQYDEFTTDFDQVATDAEDAWVLIICQMSPGGIITTIEVQEDDVPVVAEASIVNFEGDGVEVIDEGGGKATVNIPGAGGAFVRADKDGDGDYDPLTAEAWENSTKSGSGTVNLNTVFGVPAAAIAVLFMCDFNDNTVGATLTLKAKSTTTTPSWLARIIVANAWHESQAVVPIAADGTIYYAFSEAFFAFYLRVVGWYL